MQLLYTQVKQTPSSPYSSVQWDLFFHSYIRNYSFGTVSNKENETVEEIRQWVSKNRKVVALPEHMNLLTFPTLGARPPRARLC